MKNFQKEIYDLETRGRLRTLNIPGGIDLTSNDYLGLRSHPALRQAAIEALEGGIDMGAGGSRLLRGHTEAHAALEEFSASYFGAEKSLFFATGYQANAAIFTTLPARGDTVIFDALIHASARDGIQFSPARQIKVPHNDLQAYEDALKKAQGQKWIAVESVYSMDGDLAPLAELYALAQKYDAFLIVDEAHGTGVFGKSGRGLSEDLHSPSLGATDRSRGNPENNNWVASSQAPRNDAHPENLITLHTCGKALGVAGGLVCASADIIDTLINKARPFIYSTAPMPLQAVLVKRALEIVRDEPQRRDALLKLLRHVKSKAFMGGMYGGAESQIIPIMMGSDARAVEVAAALQRAGFDIRAIRPPSVPEGTARLRLSLSVNLDEKILRDFAGALAPHLQREAA